MGFGELAANCGCLAGTIRYFEKNGLLSHPVPDANGYRGYDESQQKRLHFILRSRALGFTQKEVRCLPNIAHKLRPACTNVHELLIEHNPDIGATHFSELTLSPYYCINLGVNRQRRIQPKLLTQSHGPSLPSRRPATSPGNLDRRARLYIEENCHDQISAKWTFTMSYLLGSRPRLAGIVLIRQRAIFADVAFWLCRC